MPQGHMLTAHYFQHNDSCSTIKGFLKYLWNISEDWNYIPLPTSFILFIIIKPSSSTISGIPGTANKM